MSHSSDTWLGRLTFLIGARGYNDCMRRSLQSVILYEARRCINEESKNMKPYQRKAVLMDQAHGLIESLPFLMPHQREEILWRTATSKEQINGDIAYKRIQQINKELLNLTELIKPFINHAASNNHQDWCNALEQSLFVRCTTTTCIVFHPFALSLSHTHGIPPHPLSCQTGNGLGKFRTEQQQ